MRTMRQEYGTDKPLSFKGFGIPIKKKKKVEPLPADSKISTLPAKTGETGEMKTPGTKKPSNPSWSIGPMDPEAKKKRSGMGGSMRGW